MSVRVRGGCGVCGFVSDVQVYTFGRASFCAEPKAAGHYFIHINLACFPNPGAQITSMKNKF